MRDDFARLAEHHGKIRPFLARLDAFHHLPRHSMIDRRLGNQRLHAVAHGDHGDIITRLQIIDDRDRLFFCRV